MSTFSIDRNQHRFNGLTRIMNILDCLSLNAIRLNFDNFNNAIFSLIRFNRIYLSV